MASSLEGYATSSRPKNNAPRATAVDRPSLFLDPAGAGRAGKGYQPNHFRGRRESRSMAQAHFDWRSSKWASVPEEKANRWIKEPERLRVEKRTASIERLAARRLKSRWAGTRHSSS